MSTEFPATFIAHTPSGPVPCCVPHARVMDRVMQAVGVRTQFTKAPDDAECTNCVNEATKAERKATP